LVWLSKILSTTKRILNDCQDNKVKDKQEVDHPDDWANFFSFTCYNFCDSEENETCGDTI